jgi:two-component system KDP operon response regulator KdpE
VEHPDRATAAPRRLTGEVAVLPAVIRVGELEIDLLHRRARLDGNDLHLTPSELSLLYLLAANPGRVLTRDEILDHLWGDDYVAESNVVDRLVRNLRQKLQDEWRRPRYIATVPGQGYRFVLALDDASPPPRS